MKHATEDLNWLQKNEVEPKFTHHTIPNLRAVHLVVHHTHSKLTHRRPSGNLSWSVATLAALMKKLQSYWLQQHKSKHILVSTWKYKTKKINLKQKMTSKAAPKKKSVSSLPTDTFSWEKRFFTNIPPLFQLFALFLADAVLGMWLTSS